MKKKKSYMDYKNILSEGFYTNLIKLLVPKSLKKNLTKVKLIALKKETEKLEKDIEDANKQFKDASNRFWKALEKQTGGDVNKSKVDKILAKKIKGK